MKGGGEGGGAVLGVITQVVCEKSCWNFSVIVHGIGAKLVSV